MELVLLKEVVKSSVEKRGLRLSPQMERHLQECERCEKCFPEWFEKMAAWERQPKKLGQ
jgi:hypothetical protein